MKIKNLFLFILLIGLTSCQYPIHSGNLIKDSQINDALKNKYSMEQVEHIFGSPSIIPDYSDNIWYYINRKMTRRSFMIPKVNSQRVTKFVFKDNKLENVEVYEDEYNKNISISNHQTKPIKEEKSKTKQYIENFGRFHKLKNKEKRRFQ